METATIETLPNIDLAKTQITPRIRLSSAAVFYEFWAGDYFQFETWVFSEDKEAQKSKQVIHGTCSAKGSPSLKEKTLTFHRRAARMLIKKLQCEDCKGTGEVEINIQRDGYPEMDVPTVCSECNGTGKTK